MPPSQFGLRLVSRVQQSALRTSFFLRQQRGQIFRRYQQTVAEAPTVGGASAQQSILQRVWTSEVGIKTVHFWAPVMKWALVLTGVSDFFRPAENLSLTQNIALTATGTIWTRWCFIIKPKNYLLAAVNFCLAVVGTVQVSRILAYKSTVAGSKEEAVEASVEEEKRAAEGVKEDAKKIAS